MAGFESIAAVTSSIERYLNLRFLELSPISGEQITPASPASDRVGAVRIRSEDLEGTNINNAIRRPALSIFLHRVDYNKAMRAAWSAVGHHDGRGHLPLDLHLLLTPWGANAEEEQRILGRTLQCLETQPILSGALLDRLGGWQPGDAVQLCLADLTTEDVMRTFDTLPVDYRTSLHYIARVVQIESLAAEPEATISEVLATPSPGLGGGG